MNRTHLAAFHEVATAGSVTAAAGRGHVSQPTLSEQIRLLERRYRVSLFTRHGRGIALTPLGQELLSITHRWAGLELEAEQCLIAAGSLAGGVLRLGTDAPIHAVRILTAFTRRHPDVGLSMTSGNATQMLAAVYANAVDAALINEPPADGRLCVEPLVRDRFVAYAHHQDPLARRQRVRLAELVTRRLVVREVGSATRRIMDRELDAAGLVAGQTLEVDSREAAAAAVSMRLGIGFGAESELPSTDVLRVVAVADARTALTESLVCLASRRSTPLIEAIYAAAGKPLR